MKIVKKMVKGLLITHGKLGDHFISVAEKIMEEKINIDFFAVEWNENGSDIIKRIDNYIKTNKDQSIVIFTDMFGGSPSNICLRFIQPNIEVITGINMPGLLKFLTYRKKDIPFPKLIQIIKKGAIDGINIISEYLGDKKHDKKNN